MRIGLSTTSDGYYTIAPLMHAATIICATIVTYWLFSNGGYRADVPSQLSSTHAEVKRNLDEACVWVTVGTAILSYTMLLRVLVEIVEGAAGEDDDDGDGDAVFAGTESMWASGPLLDRAHQPTSKQLIEQQEARQRSPPRSTPSAAVG